MTEKAFNKIASGLREALAMTDEPRCEPPPDHERIWLQPCCPTCRGIDDRTWCQDNVWSEGCSPGDCDNAPTEYIRADLVTPPATVAALVEALEDMVCEQQSEAQVGTGEYQRGYDDCIAAHADTARAALALYRGEAGR